jgi:CheY-like chemotaxis protein
VQEAANGREALARLQGVAPDVILLDLMTPEMDGFASGARKISSLSRPCKI